jgi:hypothetical protein
MVGGCIARGFFCGTASQHDSLLSIANSASEVLFRRAAQMLLEPPHHFGSGTCEIGAIKPVSNAFDSDERRGHASLRACRVSRRIR